MGTRWVTCGVRNLFNSESGKVNLQPSLDRQGKTFLPAYKTFQFTASFTLFLRCPPLFSPLSPLAPHYSLLFLYHFLSLQMRLCGNTPSRTNDRQHTAREEGKEERGDERTKRSERRGRNLVLCMMVYNHTILSPDPYLQTGYLLNNSNRTQSTGLKKIVSVNRRKKQDKKGKNRREEKRIVQWLKKN